MTGTNEGPAALLFLQIQTGGIRDEKEGQDGAGETKPRHNVEGGRDVNVIALDRCMQSTELADRGRETVGRGPNGRRVHLSCNNEGD
jgi:hypothetical protein